MWWREGWHRWQKSLDRRRVSSLVPTPEVTLGPRPGPTWSKAEWEGPALPVCMKLSRPTSSFLDKTLNTKNRDPPPARATDLLGYVAAPVDSLSRNVSKLIK